MFFYSARLELFSSLAFTFYHEYSGISVNFRVSIFLEGRKVTDRVNPAIVSFLAGCQSGERLRFMDARSSIAQAHILARPDKTLGFGIFGMTILSNKNQEGLVGRCLLMQYDFCQAIYNFS